ncbi:MAG: Ig-like domain-containing protein [Gammaproteobacteria bacterium]
MACSPCDGPPPDDAPAVKSTTPSNGATGVTTNSNLTITFNEPVNVAGDWFQVNCPTEEPKKLGSPMERKFSPSCSRCIRV